MPRTCPNCGSRRIRANRSRGLFLSVFLPLSFVHPSRCRDCDERFLDWSFFRSTLPGCWRKLADAESIRSVLPGAAVEF
jgi:hypothetical protein